MLTGIQNSHQSSSAISSRGTSSARGYDVAWRESLVAVQRAFVLPGIEFVQIHKADNTGIPEGVRIIPKWNNFGATPTKNFTMHGIFNYLAAGLPANFDYPDIWDTSLPEDQKKPTPAVVGPKDSVGGPQIMVPYQMEEAITDKKIHLFMCRAIRYLES
jgi:hypothetical protein